MGELSSTLAVRQQRRRIFMMSAVVVVVLIVMVGAGGELFLRKKASGCIESLISDLTAAPTTVEFSKKPLLLQLVSKKVPYMEIDTADGNDAAMQLHARADEISIGGDGASIARLQGTGSVPYAWIVDTIRSGSSSQEQRAAGVKVAIEDFAGDEKAGTVTVHGTVTLFVVPIPFEFKLAPRLAAGNLDFQVRDASAASLNLPDAVSQTVINAVTDSVLPPFFDAGSFERFHVTDKSIDFDFTGRNMKLNDGSAGGAGGGSGDDPCSVS